MADMPFITPDEVDTRISGKADAGHTHGAPTVTGPLALANLPAGALFAVYWSTTDSAWHFPGITGAVVTARPTNRTDVHMMAVGNTANRPTFALGSDIWLKQV